jgi:hypothetical protein
MSRIDIEAAKERIEHQEEVIGGLRSEAVQLRERVDSTENGIGATRKRLAEIEM